MLIKGYIKNEIYEKLLKYAFNKCDTVRFLTRSDQFRFNFCSQKKLKMLEQQLVEKFQDCFLTYKRDDWWEENNSIPDEYYRLHFYKINENLKEYLLSNKNLYAWLNPKYPEDISFFKNGYCWLYSVTHEKICNIYCENEQEYEYLKSIGIKFVDNEFKPIPKDKLYYEKY